MKKISKYFPAVTLELGLAAAIMRFSLVSSVDEWGLIPNGLPAEIILNILSIVLLLGLCACTLLSGKQDFRYLINSPIQAIGCCAAALAMFFNLLFFGETTVIFTVLRIFVILIFLLLAFFRFQAKKPPLLFFVIISFSLMILCFGQYRTWGQYTQLHAYLFPALSSLLTALYSLDFAYMETRDRSYKRTFFLNQAALYCTLVCFLSNIYYLAIALWLISGLFTMPYAVALPDDVKKCIQMLEKEGHTAYAVGGCVRDSFLGLKPQDYDLCTSATPEQICEIFQKYKLIHNGEKHGTVGVLMCGTVYEITTYRAESGYADNRHPDNVEFVNTVEEDLSRRDFTVNAMAYHPNQGYLDPFGGQRDIMNGILRTVGDPETRFREDALRILRGVRFACKFRLDVERDTMKAMKKLSDLQDNLARERVYSELTQILCLVQKGDLKRFAPVLLQSIPELKETVNFRQYSVHHAYDVFTHTQYVVEAVAPHPALRWAALLHDIGKPAAFQKDENGQGHFHGHAQISAKMAEEVLTRFNASNALKEEVIFLILHHMDTIPNEETQLSKKVNKYGLERLDRLVQLQMADDTGKSKKKIDPRPYDKLRKALENASRRVEKAKKLAINGHDLMELGFSEGPALGQCQAWLTQKVLSGEIPNEKEPLLQKAREYLQK